MFIDRVKIHAKAGDGGDGSASFRREKFIPKGGPDGGDGGDGGDVILRADVHVDQLANLFFEPILKAKPGGRGSYRQRHGKSIAFRKRFQTILWPFLPKSPTPAWKSSLPINPG
jgi:GTP-binding protein